MSFSYEGDPSLSDISAVRFELGDVEATNYELEDEEIQYALTKHNDSILHAAARCADMIAMKYAKRGEVRTGPTTISKLSVHKHFTRLARVLRRRAVSSNELFALGSDVAERKARKDDTSIQQPSFTVGMHDNTQ